MIEQYLERLFTWESLENTERGVEFELKNRLTDAELAGVNGARLDGETVPLEDVTLLRADGTRVVAADVSPEAPFQFDLGDVVRVVVDRERLRLGVHEIEFGLSIGGFGAASFTTEDEVTEADLLDADPGEYTVADLRSLVAVVTEPTTLERLDERERDGKDRKTAVEAIENRLDALEAIDHGQTDATRGGPGRETGGETGGDTGAGARAETGIPLLDGLDELVGDVLESPKHASVYAATRLANGGSASEIADRSPLAERVVESTLEDLAMEGVVERTAAGYETRPPMEVVRNRGMSALSLFGVGP